MNGGRITNWVIGLIIVLSILGATFGDLFTTTSAVANNASNPTMIRTMFTLAGWVPFTLVVAKVLTQTSYGKRMVRRFRRRRR